MATTRIRNKRSAVAGNIPTTSQLEWGEFAINTRDGRIFFKSQDSAAAPEIINVVDPVHIEQRSFFMGTLHLN